MIMTTRTFTAGPRSAVTAHDAPKPDHGSSRTWQRVISGRQYAFTAILMPSGERRYAASRLDGPDGRFSCYWHRVLFVTVPAPAAGPPYGDSHDERARELAETGTSVRRTGPGILTALYAALAEPDDENL